MSRSDGWLADTKRVGIAQVIAELGLQLARGRSLTPCPACAADRRGRQDSRGPVGLRPEDRWKCYRCDARGDAIDLVAYVLTGAQLGASNHEQVRNWFGARGWCDVDFDSHPGAVTVTRPTVAPIEFPTIRPPQHEVLALWDASCPTAEDDQVAAFLRGRGYDPDLVDELRIARATPRSHDWPSWWPATWSRTWRLVTRAWEPNGRLASLHARAVVPTDRGKTRWPKGCSAASLLFVDQHGLDLLRRRGQPGGRVIVGEGLTGLVNAALLCADEDPPIPILNATSGGFPALREVSWPSGSSVYVYTDDDDPGERYADQARTAIPAYVPVRRVRLNRGSHE